MIEQHKDVPVPDGATMIVVDGDVAFIYFAEDPESIAESGDRFSSCKQAAKIDVSNQCGEKILSGFDSEADGSVKRYKSNIESQINILSTAAAGINYKGLNPAQTTKLNQDMVAERSRILSEKDARKIEIESAITVDGIDAVLTKEWT